MRVLLAILIAAFAAFSVAAAAEEPQQVSEAEDLLFLADHFKSTSAPATLRYSFSKTGSLEKGFSDTVEIKISGNSQGRRVATRCLSQAGRKVDVPPVESAAGNPAILCFLERDIKEMERLTGGKSNYFRKRIRLALAERAEVRPVTVNYQGRELSAKEIRISPYLDDPLKERFQRYMGKYYLFVLSDEVPGTVFRAESVIPPPAGDDRGPLIDEVLALTGPSPDKGKKK